MNQLQAQHLNTVALALAAVTGELAQIVGNVDGPAAGLSHAAELLANQALELSYRYVTDIEAAAARSTDQAKEGSAND